MFNLLSQQQQTGVCVCVCPSSVITMETKVWLFLMDNDESRTQNQLDYRLKLGPFSCPSSNWVRVGNNSRRRVFGCGGSFL